MSELRIVVPTRLRRKLEQRNFSQASILKAVKKPILDALEALAENAPPSAIKAAGTHREHVRQVILEMRNGVPPALGEPFMGGLTLGQWLALSDSEQEKMWEKWEEKDWKKLERKNDEGVDVKLQPRPTGQERGTKLSLRARESRAPYTTRRKRTSRIRTAKR